MNIRDANETDLPAIVAIYNATVPGRMVTAELEPTTVERRRPWLMERETKRHPVRVMDDGGEMVAWLSFEPWKARAAYHQTAEVSVYVSEDYRRRGVARTMLTEAISQATRLGNRTLIAGIFGHNTPSIRLFESFGFEEWGRYPNVAELDGVERDYVAMGLRVG